MKVRADIAERLRAGVPQSDIARELGVDRSTVRRARKLLGLPEPKRGPHSSYASIEDAFLKNTEPVDGGHVRWTGYVDASSDLPVVCYRKEQQLAPRVAFRLHHGRDPVGQVRQTCEGPRCLAGAHLADRLIRDANRRADAAYDAIFGPETTP